MSEVTSTPEAAEQQAPNLSLQDLLLVAQIIQVSTQRGAFKAEELSNIGGLYDRLIAFLNATGAIKQAEAPESAPADTAQGQ
jgi:hypothetical protein